jgi:glycosyltransferase involved in cell wall biosynthesis
VRVEFLVHDLLCIQMPQYFPPGSAEGFTRWLEVVAESDGAVCVSRSTSDDLLAWIKKNRPPSRRPVSIKWSHNGADISNTDPTQGLPSDSSVVLQQLHQRPSFLLVGTLEPRKGHAQVLEAFEQLWQTDQNVNLIIVGKRGWMVESLVANLCAHPELNKRLFWLEGISDEYLERVYADSTCLIAASYGEGFGLPVIEAAQHKLPIIARDIPVFREVAGDHAYYFSAENAQELASAIKNWLALNDIEIHPKSNDITWLTWKESSKKLSDILTSAKII